MAIPTKAQVSRLSDDSVMVRWEVLPEPDTLPIQFFKIQYKEVGKDTKWETADGEIANHLTSQAIPGLTAGKTYRFRVFAVYSNHDSRNGPKSDKFSLLKNPPMKRPRATPRIVSTLAVSQHAIELQWTLASSDNIPLEGYYIHFRPSSSVGDYYTEMVPGVNAQGHILGHLLPDTQYDIKMQVFNSAGPSNFSNIVSNKTLPAVSAVTTTSTEAPKTSPPASTAGRQSNWTFIIVGVSVAIAVIVVVLSIAICYLKHRQNKPTKHPSLRERESFRKHLPKEKHPRANSVHSLNHSPRFMSSEADYSNPYGNYSRSSGLNGHLAKSVNGLSVRGSISSGYVFRDCLEPEKNEITIQVNPVTDDQFRINFEGRSRTLTSTTFVGPNNRSHSTRDLLRRSNHNLQNNVHERSVDCFEEEGTTNNNIHHDLNSQTTMITTSSGTTDRRRKLILDEVHPNAFHANAFRHNNKSSSFTRLNGTLERKKRLPLAQREELMMMSSSTDPSSTSPSASPSSSSSSNNNKVNNNHPIHNHHMSHHHHLHNNNDGLLTRARNCSRENNPATNGPLVIMQSSC